VGRRRLDQGVDRLGPSCMTGEEGRGPLLLGPGKEKKKMVASRCERVLINGEGKITDWGIQKLSMIFIN